MRNAELEGRQKLWRPVILLAIAVLIVETWLAGRLGRSRPVQAGAPACMNVELRTALDRVASRIRRVRLWSGLAACWLVWAVLAAILAALGPNPLGLVIELAALAGLSGLACAVFAIRSARDPLDVARRIESRHPRPERRAADGRRGGPRGAPLGAPGLLAADGDRPGARARPIARLGGGGDSPKARWPARGSPRRRRCARCSPRSALLVVAVRPDETPAAPAVARIAPAEVQVASRRRRDRARELAAGRRPVRRGRAPRGEAGDRRRPADSAVPRDDPEPRGSDVRRPGRIGRRRPVVPRRVRRRRRPRRIGSGLREPRAAADRREARLTRATRRWNPKIVEDVRHVTAVEGTDLTLLFRLNKEVASAPLVDEQGEETALATADEASPAYRDVVHAGRLRTATRSSSSTPTAGATSSRPRSP